MRPSPYTNAHLTLPGFLNLSDFFKPWTTPPPPLPPPPPPPAPLTTITGIRRRRTKPQKPNSTQTSHSAPKTKTSTPQSRYTSPRLHSASTRATSILSFTSVQLYHRPITQTSRSDLRLPHIRSHAISPHQAQRGLNHLRRPPCRRERRRGLRLWSCEIHGDCAEAAYLRPGIDVFLWEFGGGEGLWGLRNPWLHWLWKGRLRPTLVSFRGVCVCVSNFVMFFEGF